MNEIRTEIKLVGIGILLVSAVIGIYGINRMNNSRNVKMTNIITNVNSSLQPHMIVAKSPTVKATVVEEKASFAFVAQVSDRPVYVSAQEVQDMQKKEQIKQLKQKVNSTQYQ